MCAEKSTVFSFFQGFFIALRLVASAQGGNDISLSNLNQTLAAPKFVSACMTMLRNHFNACVVILSYFLVFLQKDTNSPLPTVSSSAPDSQWAIRVTSYYC